MKFNPWLKTLLISFLTLTSVHCQHGAYADANRSHKKQLKTIAKQIKQTPPQDSLAMAPWVGTVNFNMRKPNFVIIHHTAQNSCEETLKTFTLTRTQVSAHYVICRDGAIHHMLNDYLRAWQAGISKWGNNTDVNSSSIGIELDNNGFEPFPDAQIQSLLKLLANLKQAYGIPTVNFIGHEDVAPRRKNDPSVYFPWKALADKGFGIWWKDTTGIQVPEPFNNLDALRIIGYDTRDSISVIRTFNRKFLARDNDSLLTPEARKVLYSLYSTLR